MRRFLVLAALAAFGAPALAAPEAPTADMVVVWAPGTSIQPIAAVGRARGVAVLDRSPAPPAQAETGDFLKRGIKAYEDGRLADAQRALDQARDLVEKTGATGLTRGQLSDLYLYRGLVKAAQGDENGAWDELVEALVIYPSRTLDPAQYAPKVAALLARVQEDVQVKHPTSKLTVDAPPGCTALVDGEPVAGAVLRPTGPHYLAVTCPDYEPWSSRVDLTTLDSHPSVTPRAYEAPSETEVLVQARSANARAVIVVEVRGKLATIRLVGVDGRERDRRSATVERGDLTQVAAIVDGMLAPAIVHHEPWYRSRWAWVTGAVIVTAAIVIPVTAAIAGDTGATRATIVPTGKGFTF
ncbi:MAG TPA: hypothetical protein VFQ65_08090 [Kofleriaceae bacterium]|nr:hypothetical protein [Kofleriaceae bacterium]